MPDRNDPPDESLPDEKSEPPEDSLGEDVPTKGRDRSLPAQDSDDSVPEAVEDRTHRARTEAMTVRDLGPELYEVEGESGETYLVAPLEGRCTCPDHVIRGARCKHLRRVGIEVAAGRVSPPLRVTEHCAICGDVLYVDPGTERPQYCSDHSLSPGDRAVDRETGDRLFVVAVSDRRADEVHIEAADCTVAGYDRNEAYDPADRVIAAVYDSVHVDDQGPFPESLRVYSFPHGRLLRIGDGGDG